MCKLSKVDARKKWQLIRLNNKLIKRASDANKVFSLVMKTHNILRLRVLTRLTCPHLAYVSSPRRDAHVFLSGAQQAPPPLGYAHKKPRIYHSVFKSIKSLEGYHGLDRCHYTAFQSHFNKVHTRNCSFIQKKLITTRKRK